MGPRRLRGLIDRGTLVRRGFHLTSPVWLVWYWMPPDAWIGVRKEVVLVFLLCGALLVEAGRLITGRRFLGLRDYESDRLSAYAWGSLGLAIGLAFFPGELVIPTFWGMAWVDPICAYTKRTRGYPAVPLVAYAALWAVLSLLLVPTAAYQTAPLSAARIALLTPIAAAVAVAVEKPNLKHIDDDFLMFVVPLIVLAFVSLLLGVDIR